MSSNDDSAELANLDSLLEEMLTNARQITKDLTEGVINTKVASILGFIITVIQLLIIRDNWYRGPIYIIVWGIGFSLILYNSVLLYRKYEVLRIRYSRFFEIHEKLESIQLRQSRTPVEIAYEVLLFIRYNDAAKWDLIKIMGNNRQFDHWITDFLVEDGFVLPPSADSEYYRLSKDGEVLLLLLKKGNLMNSIFKLSGRRLRK